jgi:putative transposase
MCKVSVGYGDQSAQLREIREADPDGQGRHSFTAQQQTLRRLDATFRAFFKRVTVTEKTAKRRVQRQANNVDAKAKNRQRKVGYPRFKPYQRFDQVPFVAGDGAKWEPADGGRWAHATFQAVGQLKVSQHRPVKGRVKTLQLKREYRRWYVVVVAEVEAEPLPPTGRAVGVDLGVARFLTTSDGEVVANPRFFDTAQARIAQLQRRTERARLGSGNRKRLRRAVAKEWRKVRNQRRDFHHKTARALVNTCGVLALENLHINNLTASAGGTVEEPGRNVAQKAGLNRSILDAGWGRFTSILVARLRAPGGEWSAWTPATPASTATPAAPVAPGHGRTPSSAPTAVCRTPTSTGHATSQPGPGWALVRRSSPEKLSASAAEQSRASRRTSLCRRRPPPPGRRGSGRARRSPPPGPWGRRAARPGRWWPARSPAARPAGRPPRASGRRPRPGAPQAPAGPGSPRGRPRWPRRR